jgi:membrane protein DedA with SNARE-associated domain
MNIVRFAILTALGSLVWNTGLIVAGYKLGENWEDVKKVFEPFQYLFVAAMVVVVAWFFWKRVKADHAEAETSAATEAGEPELDSTRS